MRLALLILLLARSAHALPPDADAWIRLESDHFTLFSNAGERPTRRLAADLERLRATLARLDPDLELSSPPNRAPTFLFVFKDSRAFAPYRLVFEGRPVDANGYLLARPEASYAAVNADPRGDARSILYHEYLHDVLHDSYPGLPLWLHEGMAQLYGGPLEEHALWLRKNRLLPLSELFALDIHSRDYHEGERRGVFYAQSWALAHYLLVGNPERRERTLRYLRTLSRGEPADEAFRAAFGGDLDAELLAWVRRGAFVQVPAPAGPAETGFRAAPLPRADLLARLGFLLWYLDPSRRKEAEEHWRAALAAAPEHAEALAGLALLAGPAEVTDSGLGKLRAAAERRIEQQDLEGALPLLEEAVAKSSGEPREELERRLAEVREAVAWNRFGERYDEAVRLAEEGRLDEAIRILEDLAANAPTPGQADQARKMLEGIRRMRFQGRNASSAASDSVLAPNRMSCATR